MPWLHRMTWNDSTCLLGKIVTYEAVHPITNLYDLKRSSGGYELEGDALAISILPCLIKISFTTCELLVFIEVALTKGIESSVQKVLFGEPPCAETEATSAAKTSHGKTSSSCSEP